MRLIKCLINTVTSTLLLSGAGGTLSQSLGDATCQLGLISNQRVNNLTINGTDCIVSNSIITGNVTVTNSAYFAMNDNIVHGSVSVSGGGNEYLMLWKNRFFGELEVSGLNIVWAYKNTIRGDMLFENMSDEAQIVDNVTQGNLICIDNNQVWTLSNFSRLEDTCIRQRESLDDDASQ